MMTIKSAIALVSNCFVYRPDEGDKWQIMHLKDGKYYGDCEDFVLTVLWLKNQESLFWFILNVFILHRDRIYFAKTKSGEGHAIGYSDGLWFDNHSRRGINDLNTFTYETGHLVQFPFPSPIILIKMIYSRWI